MSNTSFPTSEQDWEHYLESVFGEYRAELSEGVIINFKRAFMAGRMTILQNMNVLSDSNFSDREAAQLLVDMYNDTLHSLMRTVPKEKRQDLN